jgi:hypothetical protein
MNEKVNKRDEAIAKLKVFLTNPGMFCLIVIGERGVGKRYSIEKAFESIKIENEKLLEEKCLTGLEFVDASSLACGHNFDVFFNQYKNKTLVIDDIDQLHEELQKTLFLALSTTNGKFGTNNNIPLRLLFTSNKSADELREDGKHLTGILWDRISQLIIEIPSYKIDNSTIQKDFIATWKKMKFEKLEDFKPFATIPSNTKFQKFLDDKSPNFEGGFRDLDKVACLYFNYRIYHYGLKRKIDDNIENMVVNSVIDDFSSKLKTQNNIENELSNFKIIENTLYKELERKFKIQVKQWGKKKHHTISNAEKKLGLGQGTMKNWK